MADDVVGQVAGDLLIGGAVLGELLVLTEPVSFWGGVDAATGTIVDAHHPQHGAMLASRVVLLPGSRGSSSSSSVLLECIRRRTAPLALLVTHPEPLLAAGSAAAQELYGRCCSIVGIPSATFPTEARWVSVDSSGMVTLHRERTAPKSL